MRLLAPTAGAGPAPRLDEITRAAPTLRPGRLLAAEVVEARAGRVLLRIGGRLLEARGPLTPQAGTRLRLEVTETRPRVVLRVRNAEPAPMPPTRALLRHALARRLPDAETARDLRALSARPLSPALRPLAALLVQAQPVERLDGTTVRRAFEHSGLFLEARLARGLPPVQQDRKALLLRARRELEPGPETADAAHDRRGPAETRDASQRTLLLKLIEGELARIQHQQVRSLPGEEQNGRQAWHLELPLRLPEQRDSRVSVRIGREADDGPDTAAPAWEAEIDIDLGPRGTVRARVGLREGQVYCAFRCERESTTRRFSRALPELDTRLRAAGLAVAALGALTGGTAPSSCATSALLDERA